MSSSADFGPRSSGRLTLDLSREYWTRPNEAGMIRRLYDWTLSLAGSRRALWALAGVAFLESSVFPIPPDILMIPMILAAPARAWLIALVALTASVAGGLLGYAIGFSLFEVVGRPVLELYGGDAHFATFSERYDEWGAWAVLVAGITPFPYKVITILSGAAQLNLATFVVASIIARGVRFFVLAALLWMFGDAAKRFVERRLGLAFCLFMVFLIGGFVVARYFL